MILNVSSTDGIDTLEELDQICVNLYAQNQQLTPRSIYYKHLHMCTDAQWTYQSHLYPHSSTEILSGTAHIHQKLLIPPSW